MACASGARWDAHGVDTRIYGTTKRQAVAMLAEEKPSLSPLPHEPFRVYCHGHALEAGLRSWRTEVHTE